ncbi:hypothetical protein BU25DRAFT_181647 [Macroventuria anomochaeta]|uniref:Uncharacterized protein n=1 Tax=Macroventuria anomochaeta TaxID=301207 RepID=A0ACB6RN98_9PLEO|nr:uncharacterized protein BU25DRAFT_181647 [Macroventuria anomochaeta]KAF2623283.1 hypothetical protein BU25DRAFT_181647 [Macroventuria anomochaeta]
MLRPCMDRLIPQQLSTIRALQGAEKYTTSSGSDTNSENEDILEDTATPDSSEGRESLKRSVLRLRQKMARVGRVKRIMRASVQDHKLC